MCPHAWREGCIHPLICINLTVKMVRMLLEFPIFQFWAWFMLAWFESYILVSSHSVKWLKWIKKMNKDIIYYITLCVSLLWRWNACEFLGNHIDRLCGAFFSSFFFKVEGVEWLAVQTEAGMLQLSFVLSSPEPWIHTTSTLPGWTWLYLPARLSCPHVLYIAITRCCTPTLRSAFLLLWEIVFY